MSVFESNFDMVNKIAEECEIELIFSDTNNVAEI